MYLRTDIEPQPIRPVSDREVEVRLEKASRLKERKRIKRLRTKAACRKRLKSIFTFL